MFFECLFFSCFDSQAPYFFLKAVADAHEVTPESLRLGSFTPPAARQVRRHQDNSISYTEVANVGRHRVGIYRPSKYIQYPRFNRFQFNRCQYSSDESRLSVRLRVPWSQHLTAQISVPKVLTNEACHGLPYQHLAGILTNITIHHKSHKSHKSSNLSVLRESESE